MLGKTFKLKENVVKYKSLSLYQLAYEYVKPVVTIFYFKQNNYFFILLKKQKQAKSAFLIIIPCISFNNSILNFMKNDLRRY